MVKNLEHPSFLPQWRLWGAVPGVPALTVGWGHAATGEAGRLGASQHPSDDCRKLLMFSCIAGVPPCRK